MLCAKNEKYAEQGRKIRALPHEKPDPSHEWEELVEMMCTSDDVGLQNIGHKEHEELSHHNSGRNGM
jgi:hypothetical protein